MKGQNEPRTRRCTVSRGQMRELCVSTQLVLSRSTIALSPKRGCFPRTIWETFARQGARQGAHGARRLLVKVRTVHGGCSSRCARCTAGRAQLTLPPPKELVQGAQLTCARPYVAGLGHIIFALGNHTSAITFRFENDRVKLKQWKTHEANICWRATVYGRTGLPQFSLLLTDMKRSLWTVPPAALMSFPKNSSASRIEAFPV